MKIAIAIWDDRVANALDFALRLLLVETEEGLETARQKVDLPGPDPERLFRILESGGVTTVICGALSRELAARLRQCGIEVVAFVSGTVDEVLDDHMTGRLGRRQRALPEWWHDDEVT